jgi:hypothetical protein
VWFELFSRKRQAPSTPNAKSSQAPSTPSAKSSQAPLTPNAKSSGASESVPPPKPPRILDMDDELYDAPVENINPEKSTSSVQSTTKYQAPLAPTAALVEPIVVASPAKAPAPEIGHVSSVTLVFGSSCATESPVKVSIAPIKQSTASPTAKAVIGQSAAKLNDSAYKPQALKRTVLPVVDKIINSVSGNSSPDTSINEPTKQPVAVRLAAWQSKQVATGNQEPLPVTSRVKNYEKKVSVSDQPVVPRTPIHLRSRTEQVRSPTSKPFGPSGPGRSPSGKPSGLSGVTGRSPSGKVVQSPTSISRRPSNKAVLEAVIGRSPSGKVGSSPLSKARVESPLKDGSSPQKLAPATRAMQERLMQLSEIGGRNEAVAKEQQERAAEIAALEGRWKTENVADSEPSSLVSARRGFRLYLLVY